MIDTLILLAGGLATRLKPVTETIPKSMIEVAGKPFIEHQLLLIKKNGISNVIICAGKFGDIIQKFTERNNSFGFNIRYSYDGYRLLGTGGAVMKALEFAGDDFFVMYGDSYLTEDFSEIGKFYRSQKEIGLMTVFRNENNFDKSNIEFSDGKIIRYDKKSTDDKMKFIDYGLGILNRSAFEEFKDQEVFDLETVYQELLVKKELAGFEVKNRFYEIGSFKGLEETRKFLSQSGEHN
ncbi:MAG TPA: sugar phosphate nucleotidyltransferase [Ignavibacteria bacterium]|nr:sugar phosphate nucleotidyltransferase [Ignavibacteria bacterium]HMR40223.1 sugar phosphate nucleotidyltransferase [Ignavibacteria bacterium]